MKTERTEVHRHPERACYDRETIHRIIDEALICHIAIVQDGQPFILPVIHTRIDERLYIHGSRGSRLLQALAIGTPACISMTIVDGLVLAKSAMHHSMNYRSVMVLGRGRAVEDEHTKGIVWGALVEHVVPGRSNDCRMPNAQESKATMLIEFPIEEASAKIRTGGPKDDAADLLLPHWAGVLSLELAAGEAVSAESTAHNREGPNYLLSYSRRRSQPASTFALPREADSTSPTSTATRPAK